MATLNLTQIWLAHLLINFINVNSANLPWSWDKIPLWADFGKGSGGLTDYEAQFLATHYDIISLEKCFGGVPANGNWTENTFTAAAAKLRQYSTSNDTKILFYWNVPVCVCQCYNITQQVLHNQSMWMKDDTGNPIYSGNSEMPYYDMTQEYVRNWWVNSLVTILTSVLDQGIVIDGVFADGIAAYFGTKVSPQRTDEYNNGITMVMDQTKAAFSQINPNLFVLGNGLVTYPFEPDHNLPQLKHVDGVLVEHWGAFEEVYPNGTINATALLLWYNIAQSIVKGDYGADKSLYIKAWIGPETTPINNMGPTWPAGYSLPTPTTHEGIANASAQLLTFPLAVYLCGMYYENVYFNYAWWYDLTQGYVPCPDDPTTCDCPVNWYAEFENKLGKPLGDGIMTDTFKCNRSFEYAKVYVDLEDDSSAVIQWT